MSFTAAGPPRAQVGSRCSPVGASPGVPHVWLRVEDVGRRRSTGGCRTRAPARPRRLERADPAMCPVRPRRARPPAGGPVCAAGPRSPARGPTARRKPPYWRRKRRGRGRAVTVATRGPTILTYGRFRTMWPHSPEIPLVAVLQGAARRAGAPKVRPRARLSRSTILSFYGRVLGRVV